MFVAKMAENNRKFQISMKNIDDNVVQTLGNENSDSHCYNFEPSHQDR